MRPFFISLVFLSQICFGAFTSNWYTEDAYLGREQLLTSLLRARGEYEVAPGVTPYLTFGSELQTFSSNYGKVAPNSYAYAGPGFKLSFLDNAQVFTELRGRAYYQSAENQRKLDARVLLVLAKYADTGLDSSRSLLSFYDLYSETLFTSIDDSNLIESAYIRAGLRKPIVKELMADLFIEPYATVDRIGHYYNNRADLKANVRLFYSSNALSVGLTGSYLINQYFDFANYEPNPYANEKTGFRFMFVAGGTF